MELCIENGVDDYELRSEVDGCPLSPQAEGQVRLDWAKSRVLSLRCCFTCAVSTYPLLFLNSFYRSLDDVILSKPLVIKS